MSPESVTLQFEGKPLLCRAGTSVGVALWEHGIRVLSRSPKYGRDRGLFCARGHCTGCLMRIDGVPNVRACQTEVRQGMTVARQDAGPLFARPLQAVLDSATGFFPTGFYFKWFTRPAWLSRLFLKSLRPVAGIGRLPRPDAWTRHGPQAGAPPAVAAGPPGSTDWGTFDETIVGAGRSGLAAVGQAAGRTLWVDEFPGPGGQRFGALQALAGDGRAPLDRFPRLQQAYVSLQDYIARIPAHDDRVDCFGGRVVAAYQPDLLLIRHRGRLASLRTRKLTWAAGALDAVGLFEGNDLPGLFGPRALYRLLVRDGMKVAGTRVVVCGGGLDLWLAAALLAAGGAEVTVVPTGPESSAEVAAAMASGWPLHIGQELIRARRRTDRSLLLTFREIRSGQTGLELPCEMAVLAGRGKPAYDIPYQVGASLVLDPERGGFVARGTQTEPDGITLPGRLRLQVAGEAAGLQPRDVLGGPAAEVSR